MSESEDRVHREMQRDAIILSAAAVALERSLSYDSEFERAACEFCAKFCRLMSEAIHESLGREMADALQAQLDAYVSREARPEVPKVVASI